MDKSERCNKMARQVFNKENLHQIKEGLDQLFQVFVDTLEEPFEQGNYFSHTDIMARLETVEQKKWRPIRNMFLKDPFYGYVQGDFTSEENASPAKNVLDLVSAFDRLREESLAKLEGYEKIIEKLNKEKREAENALSRLELKESERRIGASHDRTEIVTARSTIEFLENHLKEKNEKIAELQREKNVQLWEREKEKAVAEFQGRMDLLEKKNGELKKQNEVLQKKFSLVDDQFKRLKMKSELMVGEVPPTVNKSEEELKRILYLQEKDLTAVERELLSQQRVFATVLCGIKTDLFIVGESLTDPDTGQIPFKDYKSLCALVEKLNGAMTEGCLDEARSDLPAHYTYLPAGFKVKRIKRVSNLLNNRLPPVTGAGVNGADSSGETRKASFVIETYEENPRLVDPESNVVDFLVCMKHFPHLGVEFIKEHWVKFKEFDGNGDRSLDFAEVVKALTAMGLGFNAQQAEEAMREADVNHSRTLDFFEYVLVADKLINRTGKSELFHAGHPHDRKVLSKTCVVQ